MVGSDGLGRWSTDLQGGVDSGLLPPTPPGAQALWRRRRPVEPAGVGDRSRDPPRRAYLERMGRVQTKGLHAALGTHWCGRRNSRSRLHTSTPLLHCLGEYVPHGVDDPDDRRSDHGDLSEHGCPGDARAGLCSLRKPHLRLLAIGARNRRPSERSIRHPSMVRGRGHPLYRSRHLCFLHSGNPPY